MRKIRKQHMAVEWHDIVENQGAAAISAPLREKASLVMRVGMMMLSVGTGAWRVRNAMNKIARSLGMICSADIGLTTITCTCRIENHHFTQTHALPTSGINTDKLMQLELFLKEFPDKVDVCTAEQFHQRLDEIQARKENYRPIVLGFAAAFACAAFTFLLGGGWIEMFCAFLGAGTGNFIRKLMLRRHISLLVNVTVSVAAACAVYVGLILAAQALLHISVVHQAGYICAMLFIIPGFPLITGGIDLSKLDIRSGVERLAYAILIIITATLTGWVMAGIFNFHPGDFPEQDLEMPMKISFRLLASFVGVFGFSMMFNSPPRMAFVAGVIGMVANTLRLVLIDLTPIPVGLAAFIGAAIAGLIASLVKQKAHFPRISLTVPSIVIMVPGMYMYKCIYFFGQNDITNASIWLVRTVNIVFALPLGLVFARHCTDRNFRRCT